MHAEAHDRPAANLRTQVVRGVSWTLATQLVVRVVSLGTTVAIARLLTPRDIGLAAEALVFTRFAFIFAGVGLLAPLVQRKELSDEDRNTAFWTSAALGAVMSLVLLGLAGPIAGLYGESKVHSLVAVLSVTVFFAGVGLTPAALLTREMRFRALALREVAATIAGGAGAIVVAALGYGPWAIVAQALANGGVATVLVWQSIGWRPRFVYSRDSLRGMAGFSGFVFASDLLFYLQANADNLLVGRFLGAAKLGAYSIAYNVMLVPLRNLASPIQRVFFPAMSQLRDPRRVGEVWVRGVRLIAAITVPGYLGLVVVAPEFVTVVFGPRWEGATPVIQILAYVGILQSLTSGRTNVLLALDRASLLFRQAVVSSALSVLAFAAGLHWGIVGVAAAYAIASTATQAYFVVLVGRVVGVTFFEFVRSIGGVLQAAAVMALVVLGARLLLVGAAPPGARLAILIALGVTVFLPACAWRAPEVVTEVRELRAWRRAHGEAGPPPRPPLSSDCR